MRCTACLIQSICTATFFLASGINAFSQGAWEIDYLPGDSIDHSLIGKEVRIDFRSSGVDTLKGPVNVFDIRRLLSKTDTVSLTIAGRPGKFLEKWKFHVDHGVLGDQTLNGIDQSAGKGMVIKEMYLDKIDESTLTLRMNMYSSAGRSGNKGKKTYQEKVVLDRSDVKGVLVGIDDH